MLSRFAWAMASMVPMAAFADKKGKIAAVLADKHLDLDKFDTADADGDPGRARGRGCGVRFAGLR